MHCPPDVNTRLAYEQRIDVSIWGKCRSQTPPTEATAPGLQLDSNCCLHAQHLMCPSIIQGRPPACRQCMCCRVWPGERSRSGTIRTHSSASPPVPMNMMGLLVAETALMAPPPLAWPSIFVMITEPTCSQGGRCLWGHGVGVLLQSRVHCSPGRVPAGGAYLWGSTA